MGALMSSRRAQMSSLANNDLSKVENDTAVLENPGTMEELHKKCKEVMPANFEGGKLMLNKGVNNHFQVSHTINMSSIAPSGYKFGATYVGSKQISPTEAFPVLLGDIDPSGNANANLIHQFTPWLRGKFVAQVQQWQLSATQMTIEARGQSHTVAVTVGSPDCSDKSGVIVGHYLQSVTRNVALGAEIAYQYGRRVPDGELTIVSAAGKFSDKDAELSASIGMAGLHLCYYKQASEQVQIGVELDTSLRTQESVATIGYQVLLPKADVTFRGMMDSNWNLGAVLEKRLTPLPFSFALSGMVNHSKQQFRFGCGIIIG